MKFIRVDRGKRLKFDKKRLKMDFQELMNLPLMVSADRNLVTGEIQGRELVAGLNQLIVKTVIDNSQRVFVVTEKVFTKARTYTRNDYESSRSSKKMNKLPNLYKIYIMKHSSKQTIMLSMQSALLFLRCIS